MAPIIETTLRKLGVPIYTPSSKEFELSVATANFLYRFHRPDWVVRPRNGEDVATTVKLANDMGERITVKNGGHSYAGFSNADGGILIDLCNMNAVQIEEVDDTTKHMTMSAGALWGDAYHQLAINNDYKGWIVNGGRCPLVGVSGFLLGGGFGPFSRSVGMGMDQLLEVDVVTAEGKIITVGQKDPVDSKEGKLFWALRGCGGGNFGVVTRLKIKVVKLKDPDVVAGRLTWRVKKDTLEDFKAMMVDFYTAKWDNNMTIDSTWECDLPRSSDERPFSTRFTTYYDGDEKHFCQQIEEKLPNKENEEPPNLNKERENFREQLKRRALAEPSTLFFHETLWAQWSEETRRSQPTDRAYTLYSSFLIKSDPKKIKDITDIISERIQRFRHKFANSGERGTFGVTWIHVGGEISKKKPTETPYPWREADYCVYIFVRWHEKWLLTEMGAFFDQCKAALTPHSMEGKASYVNFPDRSLKNWSEAYYGENLEELRKIHDTWDPNRRHVLRFPQNIGISEPGESLEGAPEGMPPPGSHSRGGARLGPTIPDPDSTSASHAKHAWESQWRKHTPSAKTYGDFVPQGDQLPKC